MRVRALTLCVLGACSVPDKQPLAADAGVDAMIPPGEGGDPNTMIIDAPAEFSPIAAATFRFASDIADATFMCTIDGETPFACSSPYTRTLNDGPHTFTVRAVDSRGNSDNTPAEHPFSIDTAMPQTIMIDAPPALDNSVMVRFTFDSNERNVVFDCSLDGAAYTPCVSNAEVGPIADGAHSFAVRARDRAGNVDSAPAIHAWNVDTSTPDTQLVSGPSGASSSTTASFSFSSSDAGGGATFQCSVDGGSMAACTSPHVLSNLSEGPHTFAVRVRDAVGNFDPTPAMRTWNVDLTPPDTMITSGPTGTVPAASAAFSFTATENGVAYECSLDGAAFAACASPVSFTNLGQGAHTFAVRARDLAGHTDASPASRTWTVDTVAPAVTFTTAPADAGTSGPRVIFAFTANEGATAECSVDGGAFAVCASPQAYNFAAGGHTFAVRASDGGGNMTTATRTWTVACAAPDGTGAVGLLHLDDTGQTLANATGGPGAVLGDTDQPEAFDPTTTTGRFGGGLLFAAAEDDRVTWATMGSASELSVELWVRPDAPGDLFVSGDGRASLRVLAGGGSTVRIEATVAGTTALSAPVASGAWHRVLVSVQPPTLRLWVDAARTDATGLALATPLALDTIRIGGGSFAGSLDEIWVSQTAVTDDESSLARYCPL